MGIIFKGFSEWKVKKLLYKSAVQTTLLEQLGGGRFSKVEGFWATAAQCSSERG